MATDKQRKRVLILGAAGRDFHTFNTCFRDDPNYYQVVAFTATIATGPSVRSKSARNTNSTSVTESSFTPAWITRASSPQSKRKPMSFYGMAATMIGPFFAQISKSSYSIRTAPAMSCSIIRAKPICGAPRSWLSNIRLTSLVLFSPQASRSWYARRRINEPLNCARAICSAVLVRAPIEPRQPRSFPTLYGRTYDYAPTCKRAFHPLPS